MKKILLLNVILFQVAILFGQSSFQLFDGEGTEVLNGQSMEVLVTDLDAFETVSPEYFIKNISNVEVPVQMRVSPVSMVDSTNFAFCFGACFPPGSDHTTTPVNVAAQTLVGNEAVFTGHYYPDGHEGTSKVRYVYYNDNNINDTLSFTIVFNGSGEGVSELDADAVIHAYPNPTNRVINIQYHLRKMSDGDIVIYNALGTVAMAHHISSSTGTARLDLSLLPRGIYLYRIESENAFSKTYRVVLK